MIKYYDGEKAASQEVRLKFSQSKTKILIGEDVIATWRNDDLYILNRPELPLPGRIGCKMIDGAYLEFSNSKAWEKIISNGSIMKSTGFHIPAAWGVVVLLIIFSVIFSVGSIYLVPKFSTMVASVIPYSWERKLGETVEESFVGDVPICVEPNGLRALARLYSKLDLPEDTRVIVVKTPDINAFALPGNIIVFFDGLILNANDPGEVLGVMSHELAHVTEKHALEGMIRSIGFQMMLSVIIGGASDIAGSVIENDYSQDDEMTSDLIAIQTMHDNNIDPIHFINFLKLIGGEEHEIVEEDTNLSSGMDILMKLGSSHPATKERIRVINEKIATFDNVQYESALSAYDWNKLRNICSRIE